MAFSTFAKMNIYPEHFEQKIGFDRIRDHISKLCISTMGANMVEKIKFSSQPEVINRMLDQVMEFIKLITTGKPFPAQDYFDVRLELAQVVTPGTYVDQETLFNLKSVLTTLEEIRIYFANTPETEYPELKSLAKEVFVPSFLRSRADEIIDNKANIKDQASSGLASIRKEIARNQRQVLKETKKAFDLAKSAGWVPENSDITVRNGRSVIPLHAADKRALGGVIHDESASGQTVFVEATASFEINNALRKLEGDERREIIKILTNYTDLLRPHIHEVSHAIWFLGVIDFIRAKALFSIKIKALRPIISQDNGMELKKAIHPLLYLSHLEQHKTIVPLDLQLSDDLRILVISGPNAGGKSVCLKTTGLLQYMLQCGFPVSASPDSRFRLFRQLFIDIGDEQSLENDLSTYSSHLLNMKFFMKNANKNTLILIDEFGTGTEPQLGGAIAEATLEDLNRKQAFGVITTHYTNLKLLAERTKGLVNGAMLFDSNLMQPLFMLQTGRPGSSFAFEIARKIGFPENVLNAAKNKSGGKHVRFDEQLQQLEIDKLGLEKQQQKLNTTDENLNQLVEKYDLLYEELQKSRKQILKEAQEKAVNIINSSNKAIEKTIREIREAEADKSKTRELRELLEQTRVKIAEEVLEDKQPEVSGLLKRKKRKQKPEVVQQEISRRPPVIGDFVRIQDADITGELVELKGDSAVLNVNDVRLKTSLKKLEVVTKPKPQAIRRRSGYKSIINELNEKVANFSTSIDLRGKRADEAQSELHKYIDDAILLSMHEVDILHGKGFGILREIIREYLQSVDEIAHFADAPIDQGGAGITRVVFRK
ncbi:MAG: Smr/MutS family protein [Bacteroidales bacterium]|jgi:DNA mismatch repair protein MutS2